MCYVSAGIADRHGMGVVAVPAGRTVAITVLIPGVTAPVRASYTDLCAVRCMVMTAAG